MAGLAILGIGVWTKIDAGQFDSFLGDSGYELSAYMMMAAGAFVMVVGFLGCYGAIKESRCLLGLFFTCLLLIFCCEVVAGVLAVIYRNKVNEEITNRVKNYVQNEYGASHDHSVTTNVNTLQKRLKCCGVVGPDDWETSKWHTQNPNKKFPLSCCKDASNVTTCNTETKTQHYTEGCVKKLKEFVSDHLILIAAIGIGISCVQLLGMIFSCCLFCSIETV